MVKWGNVIGVFTVKDRKPQISTSLTSHIPPQKQAVAVFNLPRNPPNHLLDAPTVRACYTYAPLYHPNHRAYRCNTRRQFKMKILSKYCPRC